MKPFKFQQAKNANEAVAAKQSNISFIAGGTNLLDLMKKQIAEPDVLIDITGGVSNQISKTAGSIRVGGMVTNTATADSPVIKKQAPLLSQALLAGASPQIRNMASVAGNLLQRTRCPYFYDVSLPCNKRKPGSGCGALNGENRTSAIVGYSENCIAVHPSDMCIALAALDAEVVYQEPGKSEAKMPFKDFHRLPGDNPQADNNLPDNALITAVEIKDNGFQNNCSYVKLRDRDSYAFALISVAAALSLNGKIIKEARLASGGVAHKPWRWYEAEKFLAGKEAIMENFSQAADIAAQSTKPFPGNTYKIPMLKGAISTALQNCLTAK